MVGFLFEEGFLIVALGGFWVGWLEGGGVHGGEVSVAFVAGGGF